MFGQSLIPTEGDGIVAPLAHIEQDYLPDVVPGIRRQDGEHIRQSLERIGHLPDIAYGPFSALCTDTPCRNPTPQSLTIRALVRIVPMKEMWRMKDTRNSYRKLNEPEVSYC